MAVIEEQALSPASEVATDNSNSEEIERLLAQVKDELKALSITPKKFAERLLNTT